MHELFYEEAGCSSHGHRRDPVSSLGPGSDLHQGGQSRGEPNLSSGGAIHHSHSPRRALLHRDRTFFHGVVIGVLFGTEFVFIYLGLSFTTASHAVIFLYTAPFFVALGAHRFVPKEPLTVRKLSGLLLAFTGIVLTLWDSLVRPTRIQIAGDLMSMTGGMIWAATSVYLKRVVQSSMTPSQMLFYQLGVSAAQLSVMAFLLEPRWILDLSPLVVASLAYQGIIVAFVSYLVWFWLIQVYPVSNLSAFTFFTPLFGVLLGGLLLHEPLTAKLLSGAGLVTGGMILVNWPETRRQ